MSDLLIIARAMGAPKERGGLVPSSHRIREAGRVLRKTYKDTVSGDEILRWLINVKKVASSRVDALEICQSLLSQNFIRRVEDQAKKMKMKASIRSVNIVAEHFEAGKDCLYTYTSKTNSGKRRGRRRRGRVQRFSIMGAREALANDREKHRLEAEKMGIQLLNVRDTAEHAHVVEKRRNEVSHLRHGPTPLQRARKLGIDESDVIVPNFEPIFAIDDGQIYRHESQHNEKHDHQFRLSPRLGLNHKKKEKPYFVFHHSAQSGKERGKFLQSVTVPKANLAGQEVVCFVMKKETEEHLMHNIKSLEQK